MSIACQTSNITMSQMLPTMPKLLQVSIPLDNQNVNLVIFAVEDSGAVHPEALQFLPSHALTILAIVAESWLAFICIYSSCSCIVRHTSSQ